MSESDLNLSHDQLMSAAISLMQSNGGTASQLFGNTGYYVRSLELKLVSSRNHTYTADILAQCDQRNISLIVECKTHDSTINEAQLLGYLSTTGEDIVRKGIQVPDSKGHQSQTMFFVLPNVTRSLVSEINQYPNYPIVSWGIIELTEHSLVCPHNEFEDVALNDRFSSRVSIDFETVSLERLPYSPTCPDSKLVDAIFSAVVSLLITGAREFSVDDICTTSNPLFELMPDQQSLLRKRVRKHMIAIRKNALSKWIKSDSKGSTNEDRWRFSVGTHIPTRTIQAISARHRVYVQYILDTGTLPKKAMLDYRDEQLVLPLTYGHDARTSRAKA